MKRGVSARSLAAATASALLPVRTPSPEPPPRAPLLPHCLTFRLGVPLPCVTLLLRFWTRRRRRERQLLCLSKQGMQLLDLAPACLLLLTQLPPPLLQLVAELRDQLVAVTHLRRGAFACV